MVHPATPLRTPSHAPPMPTSRIRRLLLPLALFAGGMPAACTELPSAADREVTLHVAPYRRECKGLVVMQCMLVKERPQDEWQLFYDPIEGFEYEPGYDYRLRVLRRPVPDPPADGSSVSWRLLEMLEKTRADAAGA